MSKREITNLYNVKFEPFDNFGAKVPGMNWHKISYDKKNGSHGSYLLKMESGAKSLPHQHTGYEEFLILDGELIDHDGKVFTKGDFVTFESSPTHSFIYEKWLLNFSFYERYQQAHLKIKLGKS